MQDVTSGTGYSISELCRLMKVSRQGYYQYLEGKQRPEKHAELLAEIQAILDEDEENDSYGRKRMIDALRLKGRTESDSTIYRVLRGHGLLQKPRTPRGLTVADKAAHKNNNLLRRDFTAQAPCEKLVSDITQLPTADGNLYISGVFDCFDNACLGLSMDDNMKTSLVVQSLLSAHNLYGITGAIFHTDRGSQYTSADFRASLQELGVVQSMNSDGGRCHDNAKCESMWGPLQDRGHLWPTQYCPNAHGTDQEPGVPIFHRLLEQPQNLPRHWRRTARSQEAALLRCTACCCLNECDTTFTRIFPVNCY